MKKIIKVRNFYRDTLRYFINKNKRKKLTNKSFTLLSSNCTGGVIYHQLGLEFTSPTINLYMNPSDFIKFCANLKFYLGLELVEVKDKKYNYPIAKLEDITIHMVHYNSFIEAKQKWNERKKRINFENIYIICLERDGCSYEDIEAFDKLPFKNKVIFVKQDMPNIKSALYLPNSSNNYEVTDLAKCYSVFNVQQPLDGFDYVSWFNNGEIGLIKN